mgnify:CR=1 FL=1
MFAVTTRARLYPAVHHRTLFLSALALLTIAGCGGGEAPSSSSSSETSKPKQTEPTQKETPAPETTEAPATTQNAETAVAETPAPAVQVKPAEPKKAVAVDPGATGSFYGAIVLDGIAPEAVPLIKKGDENVKDKEVCGGADVPDETLLVGDGNGIANVFVYLRRAPKGYKSEAPSDPVVLDQKGCVFQPHVALIRTGQKVLVKSSDAVQHNVHTFPSRNQGTNLLINPNDQAGLELIYDRSETDPLQVKCDIHAWMSSYHLVLDHPFMAVTDENGKFRIEGLPAGDYEFRVWHERGGLLERAYKAAVNGEDEPVTLKYALDKFPAKG